MTKNLIQDYIQEEKLFFENGMNLKALNQARSHKVKMERLSLFGEDIGLCR